MIKEIILSFEYNDNINLHLVWEKLHINVKYLEQDSLNE